MYGSSIGIGYLLVSIVVAESIARFACPFIGRLQLVYALRLIFMDPSREQSTEPHVPCTGIRLVFCSGFVSSLSTATEKSRTRMSTTRNRMPSNASRT